MGIFDTYEEKPKPSQVASKKQQVKQSGIFNTYSTETETPEPIPVPEPQPVYQESRTVPTETTKPTQTPSPLENYNPLQTSVADGFASSLKKGTYTVNGQKPQKQDPIATAYDTAPDKWRYKQTLTNTQLDTLKKLRPESKSVSSISTEEKQRQYEDNTYKVAPNTFYEKDEKPVESFIGPSTGTEMTEQEARMKQAKENINLKGYEQIKSSLKGVAKAKIQNVFDDMTEESDSQKIIADQTNAQSKFESSQREYARRENISAFSEEKKKDPDYMAKTEGGEFYKSLKQGLRRDFLRNVFGSIEAGTAGDGNLKTINDWASKQSDEFLASRLLHPEENAPKDMKEFTEGGWKDSRFWTRGTGQLLGTVIPTLATSIGVGMATKNPLLAARVGISMIYSQEAGQAYNDLIDNGFAPSDANKGALMYGVVATALESVNFGKTLNKVLGPTNSKIATQSFKKEFINSLKEAGPDILKESGTEGAQQFAQNVMTKWYDENKDLLEGVPESIALGGLGGVGFAGINTVTDLTNKYRNNIAEAKKVVANPEATPDETTAATIAIQGYSQRTKEVAETIKNPEGETVVKIETVPFPDGTFSSSATIDIDPVTSITTPFTGEFETKQEAVDAALTTAQEIATTNDSPVAQIIEDNKPEKAPSSTWEFPTIKTVGKLRDNNQLVTIKDGKVTVTNKAGKDKIGAFTFDVSEWAKAQGTSANPHWGVKQFVKQKNKEAIPGNYNEKNIDNFSLVEQIEDAQIRAIEDAVKQYNAELKSRDDEVKTILQNAKEKHDRIYAENEKTWQEVKDKRIYKEGEVVKFYGKDVTIGYTVSDGGKKKYETIDEKGNKVWTDQNTLDSFNKTPTQEEKVKEVVASGPKTIKEVAEETGILEPNIRRILGQGATNGKFERVGKGVYTLKTETGVTALIKVADAIEEMPRLVKEGFKTDMVFLDIPYDTAAVHGGNRGLKYSTISTDQFNSFIKNLKPALRSNDTPVYHMYSTAPSGMKQMVEYNKQLQKEGFQLIETGYWTKLIKDGSKQSTNVQGKPQAPEAIALYSLSGKVNEYSQRELSFRLPKTSTASEKNAELIKSLIKQGSKEGEMVFDPFAGTGVVPDEALKAGRNVTALELSQDRVDKEIIPRIEKSQGLDSDKGTDKIAPTNQPTNGNRPTTISDTGEVSGGGDGIGGEVTSTEQGRGDNRPSASQTGVGPQGDGRPSVRFTKSVRANLNVEIKAILESKNFSTDLKDYSKAEIAKMEEYTGAGGKESTGATGRGLLDEYYTPKPVVQSMYDIASKFGDFETILEPSAGVGRFIAMAPNGTKVVGMELDKVSGTIAKLLNPTADIRIGDFQDNFIEKGGKKKPITEKFDLVIGNPPYGERSTFQKGLGEEKNISRQEEYFIKRGLDMTNDGGLLVYIVPSSFLNKASSKGKIAISEDATLIDAYRLPEGIFEDTAIGTDIVVFRKGTPSDIADISAGKFFQENPVKIIGEVGERKNKFGKMESFVKGDRQAALDKLSELVGGMEKSVPQKYQKNTIVAPEQPTREAPVKITRQTVAKPVKTEDVSGIIVAGKQTIGGSNATQQEVDMYKEINQDGSVEYREEWAPYLNYENGKYYPDEVYFSGDVRARLTALEKIKKQLDPLDYEKQKKGLMRVMPANKTIDSIVFDPMDRFLTTMKTGKTNRAYVQGKGYEDVETDLLQEFVSWVYKIDRRLIGFSVHRQDIQAFVMGERQRSGTKENTGNIKAESRRLFNSFMQSGLEPELQAKILEKYNAEKNAYVRPEYSTFPIEIDGMATEFGGQPFKLSPTQQTGVGFLVTKGAGLVAYGVGVGKTHTMLVATVANMQKGWTKRPVFIVPAGTLEGWIKTSKQMFPGIKVNNLAGLQADVVRKFKKGGEVKTWLKDGELNFLTHEGILKLGFTDEEIFDLTSDVKDALFSFDSKMTEREREKNKGKVTELIGATMKGSTDITVKDLGIDHISVDEIHNFRKVFQGTLKEVEAEEGVKSPKNRYSGTVGGAPSARARKLFVLSQYIQKNNQGRNVFLASATPFENHATEVYNILSFMARDRMKAMGIYNVNDFYAAFASFKTDTIVKPDGSTADKEVMLEYNNLQELQSLLKEFIDRKEDPTLVRPIKVVLKPVLKMSTLQNEVKSKVIVGMASDDPGAMLVGIGDMRRNAMSPYFVEKYAGIPSDYAEFVNNSPKIKYTMEMIKSLKSDPRTTSRGSFIYVGDNIKYLEYYKQYLVEQVGYKPEEIGIIFGEVTDEQRDEIKEKFNSGEIKVLIGGTPTKEGVNLQKNGYATFNLALGWNPTEMAQVEGRVWRQGNNLSHALIVYPLVENSGDINIYQKFEEKGSRINDLFSYDGPVFDMGEMDPREMKLMLLTDPIEKANFETALDEKKMKGELLTSETDLSLWETLENQLSSNQYSIETYPAKIDKMISYLEELKGKPQSSYVDSLILRETENIKATKDELKRAKDRVSNIQKRLVDEGISNIKEKIKQATDLVAKKTTELTNVKLQTPALIEKYEIERIENEKKAKTIEDYRQELLSVSDNLAVRSAAELQAEKQRLVNLVEENKDTKNEEILLKTLSKEPASEPIPLDSSTRTPRSAKRGEDGTHLKKSGANGIRSAEKTTSYEVQAFKLSARVKEVIEKMNTRFTRYVPRGADGAFYGKSKNVAFRSINDLYTVTHEVSHFIDDNLGITKGLMEQSGVSKKGLPVYDNTHKALRDELTKVYVMFYPGAKKTDKLKTRLMEGYATLQEKYLSNPTLIREKFPLAYDKLIKNAHEMQDTLNTEMSKIVQDYLNISAKDKIGSVLTNNYKNGEADSFLNFWEKANTVMADALYPIYKLERLAKTESKNSVYNALQQTNTVNQRIYKNLTRESKGRKVGATGYYNFSGGSIQRLGDENWADLMNVLGDKKMVDDFGTFLVARDQYFQWKKLDELETDMEFAVELLMDPFLSSAQKREATRAIEEYNAQKQYLDRQSELFTREDVTAVYEDFNEEFSSESELYDTLVHADLLALKESGRLSQELYDEYSKNEGYATMRRLMEEGIIGESKVSGLNVSGKFVSKASQLKTRSGGTQDIINPLIGGMLNHTEAVMKTHRQLAMNKLYDILSMFPEMAQIVQVDRVWNGTTTMFQVNGKPLGQDANTIVKWEDGNPKVIVVDPGVLESMEAFMKPMSMSGMEEFFQKFTKAFSVGTTGLWPAFAIGNATVDQFSALVHTQEEYTPFVDQIKILTAIVRGETGDQQYVREYLDLGGHETMLNLTDLSGEELIARIQGEAKGLQVLAKHLDAGLDILKLPANISETATRIVEYVKAREAGKDIFTSLEEAGQVTTPFHHKGTIMIGGGRIILRNIPYLNAIIQASAQFGKTLSTPEGRRRYGLTLAGVVSVVIGALALAEDDEDAERAYANLDPKELSKYFFFYQGNGQFYKMKIPEQLGFIGALISMAYSDVKYNANYSIMEYVDAATAFMPDAFNPTDPVKAVIAWIPQFLKPPMEVILNKKTFPAVRDLESRSAKLLPSDLRGDVSGKQSLLATQIAHTELAKKIGLSSIQIDHLIEGYLGRSAGFVTGKPAAYDQSSPVTRKEYLSSGRVVQSFFDEAERLTQEKNGLNKGLRTMSPEDQLLLNAKLDRVDEIKKLLVSYNEKDGVDANPVRRQIWEKINEFEKFSGNDVTEFDKLNFQKKEAAKEWKTDKEALIEKYTRLYKESTEPMKATKLERQLKEEMGGANMTETDKSRYSSLVRSIRMANESGGDTFIARIADMNTNDEKTLAFKEKKSTMDPKEFENYVVSLYQKKIISKELRKTIFNLK